jgi:hypothetical protein
MIRSVQGEAAKRVKKGGLLQVIYLRLKLASSPEAQKPPATPAPPSLSRVLNIQYFHSQWMFVTKLLSFVPPLRWDLVPSTGVKWLSYDDPSEQYTPDNPHIKLGIILVGQRG